MKNSGTNINYEKEISNSQMEQHLSYSMSPTKFTKGSQFGAGDKTFMNSLKIQSDTLLKKKKVLEDEQYKLQNKIKQV